LAARVASNVSADVSGRNELPRVAEEIATDLETLEAIMRSEGVAPSVVKDNVAVAAGELGRLKLNGRLRTRSPLSDVIELETLLAGISGKAALWRTLGRLQAGSQHDLDSLTRRAEAQFSSVSRCRDSASVNAFRPR
jgi:hypothetical protein